MQRKRPIQVKFRMSEDEAAQLRSKVEQSGMSQQEYLIRAATGQPIMNTEGIKELLPQLGKIGSNLNQIARALNQDKFYSYKLITENQKELNEIWQLLRQYLQEPRLSEPPTT